MLNKLFIAIILTSRRPVCANKTGSVKTSRFCAPDLGFLGAQNRCCALPYCGLSDDLRIVEKVITAIFIKQTK